MSRSTLRIGSGGWRASSRPLRRRLYVATGSPFLALVRSRDTQGYLGMGRRDRGVRSGLLLCWEAWFALHICRLSSLSAGQ